MNGRCHCPCTDWPDHDGGICSGGFERALPKYPHLDGYVMLPCCQPCYEAIQSSTDRRAITPPPAALP